MLSIKNVRRDIHYKDGYKIGEFQLIDGGLSGYSGNLENQFYTFYWSMGDDNRRFKVVVKREAEDEVYYHLWIEDLRMGIRVHNVRVMATLFTDRKRFYNWMVDRIGDSLSN